jgi:hypothetical protein
MLLRQIHSPLASALCLTLVFLAGCASNGRKWYDPLGLWAKKETEEPKIKVVTNADRIKALRNLAKIASELPPEEQARATDELCQALPKEQDIHVRSQMLRTIAVFPSPRAEAMLKGGMRDADIDVRLAAARALGKLKNPASVSALGLALDDDNPAMQFRAMQSLKAVTGKQFETVKEWREYLHGEKTESPSVWARLRRLF